MEETLGRGNSNYKDTHFRVHFAIIGSGKISGNHGKIKVYKRFLKRRVVLESCFYADRNDLEKKNMLVMLKKEVIFIMYLSATIC